MSYLPTTWKDGDVITAEKLNKLEQGVQNEQVGPQGPPGKDGKDGKDGAQGPAGPPGPSVPIVNDLTTGGAERALSAEQGKVLDRTKASNRNLLINPWLQVNQNGKSTYAVTGMTLDGWKLTNSNMTVTVKDGYITLAASENGHGYFRQLFDRPFEDGVYTLSVIARGTGAGFLNLATKDVQHSFSGLTPFQATDEWSLYTYTFDTSTLDYDLQWFYLRVNQGESMDVSYFKFEHGPFSTAAYDKKPEYSVDYALCSLYSPTTGEFVGSQHSNPNLLDNWYFPTAINQRGKATYTFGDDGGYTADRWRIGRAAVSLADEGLSLVWDGKNGDNGVLLQRNERLDIRGKVVTMSVLLADGTLHTKTVTAPTGNTATALQYIDGLSLNITQSASYWALDIRANTTTAKTLIAAKLEEGPVSTLAHKEGDTWVLNDPPPDPALELMKCQRYQVELNTRGNTWANMGIGMVYSSTMAIFMVEPPVPLRTNPVIVYSGKFSVTNNFVVADEIAVTKMDTVASNNSLHRIYIRAYTAESINSGQPYMLRAHNDKTARLLLDANL